MRFLYICSLSLFGFRSNTRSKRDCIHIRMTFAVSGADYCFMPVYDSFSFRILWLLVEKKRAGERSHISTATETHQNQSIHMQIFPQPIWIIKIETKTIKKQQMPRFFVCLVLRSSTHTFFYQNLYTNINTPGRYDDKPSKARKKWNEFLLIRAKHHNRIEWSIVKTNSTTQ